MALLLCNKLLTILITSVFFKIYSITFAWKTTSRWWKTFLKKQTAKCHILNLLFLLSRKPRCWPSFPYFKRSTNFLFQTELKSTSPWTFKTGSTCLKCLVAIFTNSQTDSASIFTKIKHITYCPKNLQKLPANHTTS
jgi:hypothetical protein